MDEETASELRGQNKRGYVAAGDPHTAEAGIWILERGGSAVDATIGATLAAFVAEPILTGPFGGGFATVAGPGIEAIVYDFFADTPGLGLGTSPQQQALDFHKLEVDFGATTQAFHVGKGATAMGWMLPGLLHMHRDHGRLPLETIAQPAIQLAKEGVELSEGVASFMRVLEPIVTLTSQAGAIFAPKGETIDGGETFHSPDLANVLEAFGQGRTSSLQAALLDHFGPPAGRLTQRDFESENIQPRKPLTVSAWGHDILLNPAPAAGGLLIAYGLKLLETVPSSVWQDEVQTGMHIIAAMAATNAARADGLDEALARQERDLQDLSTAFLSQEHITRHRALFDYVRHEGFDGEGPILRNLGGTTHISAIDADGMAVSLTSSNGEGCGHVIGGFGTMANNFMGEEDLHPLGFHVQKSGKRLISMMCPIVVTRQGQVVASLGTGGSNRIRTALLQILVHTLARKLPLGEAIGKPRVHFEGDTLFVEAQGPSSTMPKAVLAMMDERFKKTVVFEKPNMFFGGVHAVDPNGFGAGDPRRSGVFMATGEDTEHSS